LALIVAGAVTVAACGSSSSPNPLPAPPTPAPRNCADLEPAPVTQPVDKMDWNVPCVRADGTKLWIVAFYVCTDGRYWPVLYTKPLQQVAGSKEMPGDPTGAAYNQCRGQ
jgi:hypothetical protein